MLRVGVVGVGAMGRNHARVLTELSDVELVGVVDIDEDVARDVASGLGTKVFRTHQEMLDTGIDATIVAVPTSLHEDVAIDALERGSHVFVEKPIAHSIESGQRIIDSARRHQRTLMVGHIERFNPAVQKAKEIVDQDKLLLLEVTRVGPFPPRIKDVGVLVDLAVHDVDLAYYLTESEVVSSHALTSSAGGELEDSAVLLLEMANGTIVRLTTNWLTPFKIRRLTCATPDEFIEADLLQRRVSRFALQADGAYVVRELPVAYHEPLREELLQFLRALKDGVPPPVTGIDGLRALDVVIRASQSCLDHT